MKNKQDADIHYPKKARILFDDIRQVVVINSCGKMVHIRMSDTEKIKKEFMSANLRWLKMESMLQQVDVAVMLIASKAKRHIDEMELEHRMREGDRKLQDMRLSFLRDMWAK